MIGEAKKLSFEALICKFKVQNEKHYTNKRKKKNKQINKQTNTHTYIYLYTEPNEEDIGSQTDVPFKK